MTDIIEVSFFITFFSGKNHKRLETQQQQHKRSANKNKGIKIRYNPFEATKRAIIDKKITKNHLQILKNYFPFMFCKFRCHQQ